MPWLLWSPGSIKNAKACPGNQHILLGSVCAHWRGQWGLVPLTIQHDSYGNRRGRILVCWPTEDWAERNQKLQSDCRFSAISFDPGKEEPDSHSRYTGRGPDLTHTTCISPGHPAVDGQLIPGRGKERSWLEKKGSLFIFQSLNLYFNLKLIISASDTI